MECPRCRGSLAAYTLGPASASVCEACGYVGVPADHRGTDRVRESWTDALVRFTGDPETALPPVEHALGSPPRDANADGEPTGDGPSVADTAAPLGLTRAPLQDFERAPLARGGGGRPDDEPSDPNEAAPEGESSP